MRDEPDAEDGPSVEKLERIEREIEKEEKAAEGALVLFDPGYERTKGMVERPRTVGFVEEMRE